MATESCVELQQIMEAEDALKLLSCAPNRLSRESQQWKKKCHLLEKHVECLENWYHTVQEEDRYKKKSSSRSLQDSDMNVKSRRRRTPPRKRTRAWGIQLQRYLERMLIAAKKRYLRLLHCGPPRQSTAHDDGNATTMKKQKEEEKDMAAAFMSHRCRNYVVNVLRRLYYFPPQNVAPMNAPPPPPSQLSPPPPHHDEDNEHRATRAVCYIPTLIYCLRFASPNIEHSPLATLICDIAISGTRRCRNQIYWCLSVAAAQDPASSDVIEALGGISTSMSARRWKNAEAQYQSMVRDVLFRIVQQYGSKGRESDGGEMRRAQRMVDILLQFRSTASEELGDDLTKERDKTKEHQKDHLSASKTHGMQLSHSLQQSCTSCGIFAAAENHPQQQQQQQQQSRVRPLLNVISTSNPIIAVDVSSCVKILSSATMPMVVTFRHCSHLEDDTEKGTNELVLPRSTSTSTSTSPPPSPSLSPSRSQLNTTKMLVKSEDVRTDLLMLNCVRTMDIILIRELGEDLGLLTYNVLPTSPNTGIVEFVQHALTIEEIQQK